MMKTPKELDTSVQFSIPRSKQTYDPNKHKYRCCCCGKGFVSQSRNFLTSSSVLFQSNNGYLPFCISCSEKYMNLLLGFYKKNIPHAIEHFCRQVDWVYDANPLKAVLDRNTYDKIVSYYSSKKNLNVENRKTYFDSLIYDYEKNGGTVIESKEQLKNSDKKNVTLSAVEKWGVGLSEIDYKNLESHYKMLKKNNPNADNNQEIFIKDLCMLNMMKCRAATRGDSKEYSNLVGQYQKTFKEAGLRTIEERDSSNEETFGVTLATISKYTPEEFYKDKRLYEDWDEIGEYFERHVQRPMQNLMTGSDIRDQEYYVPDGDTDE